MCNQPQEARNHPIPFFLFFFVLKTNKDSFELDFSLVLTFLGHVNIKKAKDYSKYFLESIAIWEVISIRECPLRRVCWTACGECVFTL